MVRPNLSSCFVIRDGSPRVSRCTGFSFDHNANWQSPNYRCAGFIHKARWQSPKDRYAGFTLHNASWQSPRVSVCRFFHSFIMRGRTSWPIHSFEAEHLGRYIVSRYIHFSRIKRTKQSYIPWPLGFFIGSIRLALLRFLCIDQVV